MRLKEWKEKKKEIKISDEKCIMTEGKKRGMKKGRIKEGRYDKKCRIKERKIWQ